VKIMPTPERAEGERETPRASARGWCRDYFHKTIVLYIT